MKYLWFWTFILAVPLFAEKDLLKELEAVKQEKAALTEKAAETEVQLVSLKLAVQNQQNVVRQKKLILDGKDPSAIAREIRAAAARTTILWDYPLKDNKDLLRGNTPPKGISFVKDGDRDVLYMVSTEKDNTNHTITFFKAEEIEQVRGKKIQLTVMVKGKEIKGGTNFKLWGTRPQPNRDIWPAVDLGNGSYDWRKAVFTTEIPQDIGSIALILGFYGGSGEVWYKDLKIEILGEMK